MQNEHITSQIASPRPSNGLARFMACAVIGAGDESHEFLDMVASGAVLGT